MSDKPTLDATRQQESGDAGEARRPYSPPAIEEEAIFKSLAMGCNGGAPKSCSSPTSFS